MREEVLRKVLDGILRLLFADLAESGSERWNYIAQQVLAQGLSLGFQQVGLILRDDLASRFLLIGHLLTKFCLLLGQLLAHISFLSICLLLQLILLLLLLAHDRFFGPEVVEVSALGLHVNSHSLEGFSLRARVHVDGQHLNATDLREKLAGARASVLAKIGYFVFGSLSGELLFIQSSPCPSTEESSLAVRFCALQANAELRHDVLCKDELRPRSFLLFVFLCWRRCLFFLSLLFLLLCLFLALLNFLVRLFYLWLLSFFQHFLHEKSLGFSVRSWIAFKDVATVTADVGQQPSFHKLRPEVQGQLSTWF
mmetsp:Transcript_16286/g.28464  ORF Transcript_16286/g.28464 Transcript_16286/m.28464 type:complete len:311 (-) Transcript_16286:1513-2445(-)